MSSSVRRGNGPDGAERRPAILVGMLAPFDLLDRGQQVAREPDEAAIAGAAAVRGMLA